MKWIIGISIILTIIWGIVGAYQYNRSGTEYTKKGEYWNTIEFLGDKTWRLKSHEVTCFIVNQGLWCHKEQK